MVSISTILGILLGLGLFFSSILLSTDNVAMFFSLSSFLMVFGGTIAATMISYQGRYAWQAFLALGSTFVPSRVSPKTLFQDVATMIDWADIVRKKGLRSLESSVQVRENEGSFLKDAFEMLLAGHKGAEIRHILTNLKDSTFERQMVKVNIINTMAAAAPAFGMVGTLVGLVIMLDSMGNDVSSLGKALALALLTTLYGVLFAQLIFKPAALKLEQKFEMERFRNQLLIEGAVLISEGKNAATVEDHMNAFLSEQARFKRAER